MIIHLPNTTTNVINKRMVELRDEGGAVALGRVLTLIVDATDSNAETAIQAANNASREHPCRVITVSGMNPEAQNQLDAEIRIGGDAGASEVLKLTLHGALAKQGAAVVTPLLLPDAPVVAWWPNDAPDDPAKTPLGQIAQRRITDSSESSDPCGKLRSLRVHHQAGDTDLAWTRLTHWRAQLAAAMDLPPFEPAQRAVVIGSDDSPSTDLIGAWLAHSLACPVERIGVNDVDGLQEVRIERESGPIVLSRPNRSDTAILTQPGQPQRDVALPLRSLTESLTEDLRRLDPDEVYGEVLVDGLSLLGDS